VYVCFAAFVDMFNNHTGTVAKVGFVATSDCCVLYELSRLECDYEVGKSAALFAQGGARARACVCSEPSTGALAECNRLTAKDGILSGGSQSVSMIMGVVLVITAVCYSALRTSSAHNELLGGAATGTEGTAGEYTALLTTDSIDKVADAAYVVRVCVCAWICSNWRRFFLVKAVIFSHR
jgi:hypothetical protein